MVYRQTKVTGLPQGLPVGTLPGIPSTGVGRSESTPSQVCDQVDRTQVCAGHCAAGGATGGRGVCTARGDLGVGGGKERGALWCSGTPRPDLCRGPASGNRVGLADQAEEDLLPRQPLTPMRSSRENSVKYEHHCEMATLPQCGGCLSSFPPPPPLSTPHPLTSMRDTLNSLLVL